MNMAIGDEEKIRVDYPIEYFFPMEPEVLCSRGVMALKIPQN